MAAGDDTPVQWSGDERDDPAQWRWLSTWARRREEETGAEVSRTTPRPSMSAPTDWRRLWGKDKQVGCRLTELETSSLHNWTWCSTSGPGEGGTAPGSLSVCWLSEYWSECWLECQICSAACQVLLNYNYYSTAWHYYWLYSHSTGQAGPVLALTIDFLRL